MVYNLGPSGAVNTANTFTDVLANPEQCALDAPLMRTLLVNTIRVYNVNSAKNHTECMTTFEKNGIYVLLGLWTPHAKIDSVLLTSGQRAPALSKTALTCEIVKDNPDWNQTLFNHFTTTLEEFSRYDNLLAVDIGNEVIGEGKSRALYDWWVEPHCAQTHNMKLLPISELPLVTSKHTEMLKRCGKFRWDIAPLI